jgi:biotin-[acetyl-CoA-carboxylase] ligase BirA-like protein
MSVNGWTHHWAQSRGHKSTFVNEVSSTLDLAKDEFRQQDQFHLFVSDHQSQGRGRKTNGWMNLPHGEVLLSTWSFALKKSPQPILTPLLGLAIFSALESLDAKLHLRLKAPNDILLNGAKLSGLLVEVNQQGFQFDVFVGLGLNVLGAPQVDQPTACLADEVSLNETLWQSFCQSLFDHFSHAMERGVHSHLIESEQNQLLYALNCGLDEDKRYLAVSPQGDLQTPSGWVHWLDL